MFSDLDVEWISDILIVLSMIDNKKIHLDFKEENLYNGLKSQLQLIIFISSDGDF